jgi:hypothetical protein
VNTLNTGFTHRYYTKFDVDDFKSLFNKLNAALRPSLSAGMPKCDPNELSTGIRGSSGAQGEYSGRSRRRSTKYDVYLSHPT